MPHGFQQPKQRQHHHLMSGFDADAECNDSQKVRWRFASAA